MPRRNITPTRNRRSDRNRRRDYMPSYSSSTAEETEATTHYSDDEDEDDDESGTITALSAIYTTAGTTAVSAMTSGDSETMMTSSVMSPWSAVPPPQTPDTYTSALGGQKSLADDLTYATTQAGETYATTQAGDTTYTYSAYGDGRTEVTELTDDYGMSVVTEVTEETDETEADQRHGRRRRPPAFSSRRLFGAEGRGGRVPPLRHEKRTSGLSNAVRMGAAKGAKAERSVIQYATTESSMDSTLISRQISEEGVQMAMNGAGAVELDENRKFAKDAGLRYSLTKGGDVRQVIVPPVGLSRQAIARMAEYRGRRTDALNGHATGSGHILEPGVQLVDVTPHGAGMIFERLRASAGGGGGVTASLPGLGEDGTTGRGAGPKAAAVAAQPADMIETLEDIQIRCLANDLSYRMSFGREDRSEANTGISSMSKSFRSKKGGKKTPISPGLARRLRDFQFAQEKRRNKYGNERPWGILGLYDHLAAIRIDMEWAEDAAWRRNHNEPYLSWADFDDKKRIGFNQPFFIYFLLVTCTAMLVASIGFNGWELEPLSVNPMMGPSAETLIKMGAKEAILIVRENQVWRLITPMVLHAGIIHFAFNMLALWFVGSAVEQNHGSLAAAIIYVIPAIGGNILSAIFLPEYISVGASGGIFGLIGACIADIVLNWSLLFSKNVTDSKGKIKHISILIWLLLDIVFNSILGLTPFVDNFTHMGGMVYGFLCGIGTLQRLRVQFFGIKRTPWQRIRKILGRFFGLIISVIGLMVTVIVLLEGNCISPCPSCRYISCIPFPPWNDMADKWWYCDDCGGVSADARMSDSTGKFDELALNCPDDTPIVVKLSQPTDDKIWLEKQLPLFCREKCENIYTSSK